MKAPKSKPALQELSFNYGQNTIRVETSMKWQFLEISKRLFQKAEVSLTASILKDAFSKLIH